MTTAPGTPSWLRERNDRTALEALFEHGPLTRNRLGELTGMSKPTAAQMVARLETAGLIGPVGEVSGGRGPNAVSYGVLPDRARGVAIDIREKVMVATVVDALDGDHPVVELDLDTLDHRDRTPEGDVRAAIDAACAAADVDPRTVVIAWVGVEAARFRWTAQEQLHWYASSSGAERGFCACCGSPIVFRSERWPGEIHLARALIEGELDRAPQLHVFHDYHVPWVSLGDDLPRKGNLSI